MTAITLNLLAEEQLAERAEARDPFKLALAIGLGLFTLTAVAGMAIARQADKQRADADGLQARLDSLETTQPNGTGGDTKTLKSLADDLLAINQGRQLYARHLAMIKDLIPDSIQLRRMSFALSLDPQTSAPPPPVEGDNKKAQRAAKPPTSEHLSLLLDGTASNSRPEIEVDQFIQTLRTDVSFSREVKDVKLRSIARSAGAGDSTAPGLPSVIFVIECQYKDSK